MNSRVSWSVDGIDPSVRERAEAAARRAGMSLSDWINSTVGEPAPPSFSAPAEQRPAMPRQIPDVADIHQRLDSITRQIEQISRPAPRGEAPRSEAARGEAPRGEIQFGDACRAVVEDRTKRIHMLGEGTGEVPCPRGQSAAPCAPRHRTALRLECAGVAVELAGPVAHHPVFVYERARRPIDLLTLPQLLAPPARCRHQPDDRR